MVPRFCPRVRNALKSFHFNATGNKKVASVNSIVEVVLTSLISKFVTSSISTNQTVSDAGHVHTEQQPPPDRPALTSEFPPTADLRDLKGTDQVPTTMDKPAEKHTNKLDLLFILNQSAPGSPHRQCGEGQQATHRQEQVTASQVAATTVTFASKARTELTRAQKKKKRECTVDGCNNYIVHKGLCCKHGVRVRRPTAAEIVASRD